MSTILQPITVDADPHRSCRDASPAHASYARRVVAADRIQALLSDVEPKDVPPIPLVPYAIGLSLTVAYRCIRTSSRSDIEQQKANLNTRSKMLESLSTYWWTANAMAKLGQKALKSMQNPVGVKRAETDNIASAMDAEVTACKFGPFDPKENKNSTEKSNKSGDALRLLSDAAATHNHTPHSTASFSQSSRANNVPGANFPHNNSIDSSIYQSTPLTDTLTTPGPTDMNMTGTAAGPNDPTAAFDSALFAKFDGEYGNLSELDNMFDGFYDLSMPTVTFQDFEGWPMVGGNGYDAYGGTYVEAAFEGGGQMGPGAGAGNVGGSAYPDLG